MNVNNFTIKVQETLQQAQQLAFDAGNQSIETGHLLKALLAENGDIVGFLMKKNNVNLVFLNAKLDEQLQKYPKVSGEGGQFMSRDANTVLMRASSNIKDFKDEFVSVEHLLLAILDGNDETAKLLKDVGLITNGLRTAILELRKGSTVNTQSGDSQYNA
ncbi:MAG: Clp protease N-terminal domain-containing protein, partial [Chitinophagaceae bacterium]